MEMGQEELEEEISKALLSQGSRTDGPEKAISAERLCG
jgi:hypothetical protein